MSYTRFSNLKRAARSGGFSGYSRGGLGDLLSEPNLPLTPESVSQSYSLNSYNAAVAEMVRLKDEWETIREAYQLQTGINSGPPGEYEKWAPLILAAENKVREYEARINAIEAYRRSLSPVEAATSSQRAAFDAWFEQIFKPTFSSTFGSTTNEDTLRREIIATWAPNNPEWAEEVIAWVKSSPVAWKMAPGSNPFPVPGATSVTYPDGTVVTPVYGELAPAIPRTPTAVTPIEQIDDGPLPPGSVPAEGVPVPPSWQQPAPLPVTYVPRPSGGGSTIITDYYVEDANGQVVQSGQAETGFLSAGIGSGLAGLLMLGAIVGMALKGSKTTRRPRKTRRVRR